MASSSAPCSRGDSHLCRQRLWALRGCWRVAMSDTLPRFYFVCECGVKLFAMAALVTCPRCGKQLLSSEEFELPWKNHSEPSPRNLTNKGRRGKRLHRPIILRDQGPRGLSGRAPKDDRPTKAGTLGGVRYRECLTAKPVCSFLCTRSSSKDCSLGSAIIKVAFEYAHVTSRIGTWLRPSGKSTQI